MVTNCEDVSKLVNTVRESFKKGITKNDINFRRQQLLIFKRFLTENKYEMAKALYQDLRRHETETLMTETSCILAEIEYMLDNLNNFSKAEVVKPHYAMNLSAKCTIRKEPKGVVLIIGSWNLPIYTLLLPAVGAIAAGNCVVLKPSEQATQIDKLLGRLWPEYFDTSFYTMFHGGVEETKVLLQQKFDHIFFTGSGTVGKAIMLAATKTLTPVTLELGGKSPVVIAPDADLKLAASRIIWGKLVNCGQLCVAPDYVMIHRDQMVEFAKHCRDYIKARYGENPQDSDSYGRVINQKRFDVLQSYINDADINQIIYGGQTDRKDLYIAPTIIAPVPPSGCKLMEDEIFGPILPIVPIETIDEAIDIINSKTEPLSLYVFTSNRNTSEKILNHTQSGGAIVNDLLIHTQESSMPFGGTGASGIGSYHGRKSFDTFSHERSTMFQTSHFEQLIDVRYPPYTHEKSVIIHLSIHSLPEGLMNKVKAIYEAVSAAKKYFLSK